MQVETTEINGFLIDEFNIHKLEEPEKNLLRALSQKSN